MTQKNNQLSPLLTKKIKKWFIDLKIDITHTIEIEKNHCHNYFFNSNDEKNLYDIQRELSEKLYHDAIDVAVIPAENRHKKLLISDMDSTMIQQECIDELADFVGKKAEISAITEEAMQGKLNFEESLISRVAHLKGLPENILQKCYDEKIILMDGAKSLLDYMRQNHSHTVLVSGGFTFFAQRVADALGFDEYHANILEFDTNQYLTGTVKSPILGKEAKLSILEKIAFEKNISLTNCLAVGDGANDLAMIKAAGLGVAYHAKPAVASAARVAIHFCGLEALIYLQKETPFNE